MRSQRGWRGWGWPTVKYEDIYLKEDGTVPELEVGLDHY
jgi:hypothetical protein